MTEVQRGIPRGALNTGATHYGRQPFLADPIAPADLQPPPGLSEAVAARLCHDLAGPIGAVANGVELLGLAGGSDGPELSLVTESAAATTARLRLLRLAFGPAAGPEVARPDLVALLAAIRGERLSIEWQPSEPVARAEAKVAALAILCLDAALPRGGRIAVRWEARWRLDAEGSSVAAALPAWGWLTSATPRLAVSAETVPFPLLRLATEERGRRVAARVTASGATLLA